VRVRAPAPGSLRLRPLEDASPRQQGLSFITHLSSHLRTPADPTTQKLPRSSPQCWVPLERFYIFSRCFCRPSSLQSNSLRLVRHNTRRITLRELFTSSHCESADCLHRFTLPAGRAAYQNGQSPLPGPRLFVRLQVRPGCICLDRPLRSRSQHQRGCIDSNRL
jgi:hypothetical protein